MSQLAPEEFLTHLRVIATITPTPVVAVSKKPEGPAVELSEYRTDMEHSRLDSVGTAGVRLDKGPTGAGKSTADLAAFHRASRSLAVQPTHENCEAVVKDCEAAGVHAVAYPGRFSAGEKQNCWNTTADAAEAMGLCVVAAVCNSGCESRRKCVGEGYLGAVAEANKAQVAVATHTRATHSGLASLSEGRDYIVLHEDCVSVLGPQIDVSAADLQLAQTVLNRLLSDPEWLARFGEAFTLDVDGETWVPDPRRTERRDHQYQFCQRLADVVDELVRIATSNR